MREKTFYDYTVYEDGTVLSKRGKPIYQRERDGRIEMQLTTNEGRKTFILSRFLYWLFIEQFDYNDKNLCVSFKDGNKSNIKLNNLYLTHRKNLIQGDGNRNRTKITEQQANAVRELYVGKVGANQHDKNGLSYKDIADILGVTKAEVAQIIKGRTRNKENYKFK